MFTCSVVQVQLCRKESEISNLYFRGKNASRGTHPYSRYVFPLVPLLFRAWKSISVNEDNTRPPGLHAHPASGAPQGKGLENSKSPEQLGSLFTVLAACIAVLPVFLKYLGNTQSLQKFELGSEERK